MRIVSYTNDGCQLDSLVTLINEVYRDYPAYAQSRASRKAVLDRPTMTPTAVAIKNHRMTWMNRSELSRKRRNTRGKSPVIGEIRRLVAGEITHGRERCLREERHSCGAPMK